MWDELLGNKAALADHYGCDKRTVGRWAADLSLPSYTLVGASQNATGGISRRYKPEKQLLPARLKGPQYPKPKPPKKGKPQLIVAGGDVHAPLQDAKLEQKFEAFLEDNEPDRFVLLGDLNEHAGTSRWKDRPGQPTEQECVDGGYHFLRRKREVCPQMQIDWIEGNHDLRPEDYVNVNAAKVSGLCRAGESTPVLSVEHYMRLDELQVNYVRGYPLAKVKLSDNLVIAHGNRVKKGAGATALANLEKRGYSIVTGHTHRLAIVFKTTLDADDSPSTLCGAETGTFKHIEPESYDEAPDHQNGFVTISLYPDGQFHIEPALFSGGFLRWRGKRY